MSMLLRITAVTILKPATRGIGDVHVLNPAPQPRLLFGNDTEHRTGRSPRIRRS